MKINYRLGSVLFLTLLSTSASFAQANGFGESDYGANRRVVSKESYSKLSGTFDQLSIAPDAALSKSKPQAYIGGGLTDGSLTIDYGLSYEFPFTGKNGVTKRTGWTIFYMVTDGSGIKTKRNPHMGSQKQWRAARNELPSGITFSIQALNNGHVAYSFIDTHKLHDGTQSGHFEGPTGKVILPVNASTGHTTQAAINSFFVKHVTAITQYPPTSGPNQRGTATLDNSWFKCRWTTKSLGYHVYGSPVVNSSTWADAAVNIPESGIDTPGKDGRNNWIIDFAPPGQRSKHGAGTPHADPNRYNTELVKISLMKPTAAPRGIAAARGVPLIPATTGF